SATKKTSPHSFDVRIHKLNEIQRGWVNYFRMASMVGKLRDVEASASSFLFGCLKTINLSSPYSSFGICSIIVSMSLIEQT
ncbi:MAG: hypothetical protein M3R25_00310, partial [Bacteroidota bacterium]|nr:hypothetical protein [Bacteroidota bacterium]